LAQGFSGCSGFSARSGHSGFPVVPALFVVLAIPPFSGSLGPIQRREIEKAKRTEHSPCLPFVEDIANLFCCSERKWK
jgi:hypothetical protein